MKDVWISGVTEKYPSSLLDGRLNAEASTIGLIWHDPLILDETKLSDKDFLSVDGRFYFELLKNCIAITICNLRNFKFFVDSDSFCIIKN